MKLILLDENAKEIPLVKEIKANYFIFDDRYIHADSGDDWYMVGYLPEKDTSENTYYIFDQEDNVYEGVCDLLVMNDEDVYD